MAASIQVSVKASNVCLSCRVRKQKCDRALPKCSRCAAKLKHCDYTVHTNLSCHAYNDQPVEALIQRRPSGYDLSWRSSAGLLQAVYEIQQSSFINLVYRILDLTGVTVPHLIQDYFVKIHPWFPVLGRNLLQESCSTLSIGSKPSSLLRLLAILLVTRHPCGPEEHPTTSVLYTTLKQLVVTSRPVADSCCDLLQCNLLIALYEYGQGLTNEAFLTLGSSVALQKLASSFMRQIRSSEAYIPDISHYENIILILDRTISWSGLDHPTPLNCYPQESTDEGFQFDLPSLNRTLSMSLDDTLKRLQLTCQVALTTGQAFQYLYEVKDGNNLSTELDVHVRRVENMVAALMREKQSHSWMFCDGIAMGLSCLLALHQTVVKQANAPLGSQEHLALRSSQRMAWEICKVSMEMINPSSVSQLSFVGMCYVFRAAVVLSDSLGLDVVVEDLEELLPTLRCFSERWAVGVEYLRHIELSGK
ncbi:uncharacterized protein BKA55DRAFT_576731 [Fusarium redolens]|uniref:Zn(2)-C6 fungal-type domain-containing protein n=1 Tax=Fusarium redolens TaxID=48865 RepID=A0A9P9GJ93_FUSRE|nr:uncharacterized protein BKA55DRAFT_576731 [Fusarium redolens]KAH7239901.1 hypothetical protein BKA55DRAFT_576731 [Fusarium redolens]